MHIPILGSVRWGAVHLATAEFLVAGGQAVGAFVTYDKRLAEAAERAGLAVVAPN